ncbi:MAG: hypothetical protein II622_07300 [Thermoguttaceae bacterium]|nr:hypothetical protein [Thermoguttaceae bacterium]
MPDPVTYTTVDLANSVVLGKDCTLNVGGGKLNGVRSVSITCESDEIDVTCRDDNGFAKALPGKKTVTIDVEFERITSDAGQSNIYAAWKSTTPKGLAVTTTGGAAIINTGTFVVTSLDESQDMDDAVIVSATLKNYGEVTLS